MRFKIFGGFEVIRNQRGIVNKKSLSDFWSGVEAQHEGLSLARGCYIFSIRSGPSITPWYVGKADGSTFVAECYTPHKLLHYNDALLRFKKCTPLLYLVAMVTPKGKYVKPSTKKSQSIAFLEILLISRALKKNPDLLNVKGTKLLKELVVEGYINRGVGVPSQQAQELSRVLDRPDKGVQSR